MSLILDGTNGVSDIDGSAATPAIRGTDANTGMFFPAADTIAFSEGGVESMRLNSSGVLVTTNDASISGLTVGKGGGADNSGTAVGYQASLNNAGNNGNSAFGYQTLLSNTNGYYNAAFGRAAMQNNTTGFQNTAIGMQSLLSNTTASNNTAVGYQAGYSLTTGGLNALFGYQAGYSAVTGANHVFIGRAAGFACTSTVANTFVGDGTGGSVTTGKGNMFIGSNNDLAGPSGFAMTTGNYNTIIGSYTGNQGGLDIRTASNNIVLSDGAGNPRYVYFASGGSHFFSNGEGTPSYGGDGLIVPYYNGNNRPAFRSYDVNSAAQTNNAWALVRNGTQVGTVTTTLSNTSYNTSSDYRLKENIAPMTGALATVVQLKPVTYDWKIGGSGQGFIAHELAEIVPECVNGEKDAVDAEGKPVYQGIDTSFLVATLTAAIQELNTKVTALEAQLGAK